MEKTRVLLFLDSLVDVMMGCVESVNPEWCKPLAVNGYHYRLSNTLSYVHPDVDDIAIKKAWDNRNVETLKLGLATEVLTYLCACVKDNRSVDAESPEYWAMELTLNTWPYKLSENAANIFANLIAEVVGGKTTVKVIHANIDMIGPHFIKPRFDHVILYDINEWTKHHINALPNCKMPDVIFTVPVILLDGENPKGKDPKEIVRYLKLVFANHLTIDPVPLKVMSYYSGEQM